MNEQEAVAAMGAALCDRGIVTPAQIEAGQAGDLAAESTQAAGAPRDAQGRFAPAAPPSAAESREVQAVRAMADSLVSEGTLTRAEADEFVERDVNELQTGEEGAPVELSKGPDPLGKIELDPVFDRPAEPSGYRFPPAQSEELDVPTMQAIQQLCFQARLPPVIASELFSIADSYEAKDLDDGAIALLTASTMAQLRLRYGDKADAKIEQGRRLVADVAKVNPALLQLIGRGLGSDLRFVSQIIEHAGRVYAGKGSASQATGRAGRAFGGGK